MVRVQGKMIKINIHWCEIYREETEHPLAFIGEYLKWIETKHTRFLRHSNLCVIVIHLVWRDKSTMMSST